MTASHPCLSRFLAGCPHFQCRYCPNATVALLPATFQVLQFSPCTVRPGAAVISENLIFRCMVNNVFFVTRLYLSPGCIFQMSPGLCHQVYLVTRTKCHQVELGTCTKCHRVEMSPGTKCHPVDVTRSLCQQVPTASGFS